MRPVTRKEAVENFPFEKLKNLKQKVWINLKILFKLLLLKVKKHN